MPEPECTCPGAGFCERYGLQQGEHHVHLCRTVPAYREKWAKRKAEGKQPEPLPVSPPEPPKPPGPGKHLHDLLANLGITPAGCSCATVAAEMDRQGVEWCRQNRAALVDHLRREADKRSWWEKTRAAALAVASGLAFRLDPLDPFGSLVDEAIRRASPPPPA